MPESSLVDKIYECIDGRAFIVNNLQSLAYGATALYGKYLQEFVKKHSMEYNWAVGHLGDIAGAGLLTSLTLMFVGKNKILQKIFPIGVFTVLSLDEYLHFLNPSNKVTDFQDVLCYAGVALLAYIGNKIITSERISNVIRGFSNRANELKQ